ncbi:hypothetical protein [Nocardia thailandica]
MHAADPFHARPPQALPFGRRELGGGRQDGHPSVQCRHVVGELRDGDRVCIESPSPGSNSVHTGGFQAGHAFHSPQVELEHVEVELLRFAGASGMLAHHARLRSVRATLPELASIDDPTRVDPTQQGRVLGVLTLHGEQLESLVPHLLAVTGDTVVEHGRSGISDLPMLSGQLLDPPQDAALPLGHRLTGPWSARGHHHTP